MSAVLQKVRRVMSRLRYQIRKRRAVAFLVYMTGNLWHALFAMRRLANPALPSVAPAPTGSLAMCLRFRDEARYLHEYIEYYLAAGADHFFLYNNYSHDNYAYVLTPYIETGKVTLIDWPRKPASPFAENDCISRACGRFKWVDFMDADEFVVVRDGRSIVDFLAEFERAPGVALHWYYYGSSGHRKRPHGLVTNAYQYRAKEPNIHVKVFVQPEWVTCNRNSHSFFYRRGRCAVDENHVPVYGSLAVPASAKRAWINHNYVKSFEDYMEKTKRSSTLDAFGMREPSRRPADADCAMARDNDVFDLAAVWYYQQRRLAKAVMASKLL